MNQAAIDLLICPHCGGELRQNGGSLICSRGHTMNIARQGYVSLLGRDAGTHTADSAEMIAARERFLASGHFDPLFAAIIEAASDGESGATGAVVDLGCGTGQYLATVLEALPGSVGIGIDNSKFAARRAAKCHPRASAVVADIWDEIPIRDGGANLMLNVFSPRNGEEMERILAPGGRLVVVTPQAGHLAELIERFAMISVDREKTERLERSLGALGEGASSRNLEWTMTLGRKEIRDLVSMGPSAGRLEPEALEVALESLEEESAVAAAVTITVAERRFE